MLFSELRHSVGSAAGNGTNATRSTEAFQYGKTLPWIMRAAPPSGNESSERRKRHGFHSDLTSSVIESKREEPRRKGGCLMDTKGLLGTCRCLGSRHGDQSRPLCSSAQCERGSCYRIGVSWTIAAPRGLTTVDKFPLNLPT